MTKDEAQKRFDELGGNSREGNGPFDCMPIMLTTLRVLRDKISNSTLWNNIELPIKTCNRKCSFYYPPVIYNSDKDPNTYEVMYPSCECKMI